MMHPTSSWAAVAAMLASAPRVLAGFSATSSSNLAVYWGQNSANTETSQQRLSYYCNTGEIDIINVAFLTGMTTLSTNFANAGNNCTTFAGTNILSCPQIEEDIIYCQSLGITVLMSIGGGTYTEEGFSTAAAATAAAQTVWSMFGTSTESANRPFGSAIVDGFDFDFETSTSNMAPFAEELRSLMDAASSVKPFYLSAAPQCPYPDIADNDMLDGAVYFDLIQIQFYNNPYCGDTSFVDGAATQSGFDFSTWDNWAKTVSLNPDVRVLLGSPANTGAASNGYVTAAGLTPIIEYCQEFSSFGGAMLWDASQLWLNPGFLNSLYEDLHSGSTGSGGSGSTTTTTTAVKSTTTASTTTTLATSTTTTTSVGSGTTGVAQWGQCGGEGYTGSTVCASPYSCVELTVWWSQCE
ncbi:chitinase [Xylariales sp. PMI_506]|nr:chitinase [Xylariales sp. PMI_506]